MFKEIRELQKTQPWTDLWSEDYKKDPRSYKGLEHCLINIVAKAGAILQRIEMSDHYGPDYSLGLDAKKDKEALAYIIMSALKAANVHPHGLIDIASAIEGDLKRRTIK